MLEKFFDKVFDRVHGSVFGILSALIGIFCDSITIFLYPGYDMTKNMVSDLGYHAYSPGFIIFNLGVFTSGLIAIPFYVYIGRLIRGEENVWIRGSNVAVFFSIVGCISMAAIGVFPSLFENKAILYTHVFFALLCWFSGIVYMTILSFIMAFEFTRVKKFHIIQPIFSFFITIIFILFLINLDPTTEWIGTFGILAWALTNGTIFYLKQQ